MFLKGAPWYILVLTFVGLTAFSLLLFNLIRVKIMNKYKFNKNYVFALMIAILFVPFLVPLKYTSTIYFSSAQVIIFTVLMLIYLEIVKIDRELKNRPVVGKPMPKAHRANKNEK